MRVLHLVSSLDPAGGGPPEGIRQYAIAGRPVGHRIEVATLDAPDAPFLEAFPAPVHALGPGFGKYRYAPALLPWLRRHAGNFDAVIVNGLWQYQGCVALRALRRPGMPPYFVFTHGMLDPWFRRAYPAKHLKKLAYWLPVERRVLAGAAAVLSTCEEERRLASQSFPWYRRREVVVGYGIAPPPLDPSQASEDFFAHYPQLRGRRILLFLSRLHEKKGLDLLIEAFAGIAGRDAALALAIAGPDGDGTGARMRARVAALGLADRVVFTGMLAGNLKWGAFGAAEAFTLASHQENFGIVVAEALACSLPVLISDKVNIWREAVSGGGGMAEPDDAPGTRRLLERWLALDAPARAAARGAARLTYAREFTIASALARLMKALEAGVARHRAA